MNKKQFSMVLLTLLLFIQGLNLYAIQRFPKPDFETKYTQPVMQTPSPKSVIFDYMDVVVLIGSLSLVSWLVLKNDRAKGCFG
jgi:NosR/NirI family transcriptional regulator, nitrous oxide reductase regulator